MTTGPGGVAQRSPIERFRATSGRPLGVVSLLVIAGLLLHLAVNVHTVTGVRIAAGLVFAAVLVWVTQLRPCALAYTDKLVLRNSLRDVAVPLAAVDEVAVRRMLVVWIGTKRYVCIGIGTPLRTMVKAKGHGPSTMLGFDRLDSYTRESTPPLPDQVDISYQDFVEKRIAELAADARQRAAAGGGAIAPARTTWAIPELAALMGAAAIFLLTLR